MIDCGHNVTTEWKPGNYLASLGVMRLDMLAITNYDEDHVSGLPNLVSRVHIDWLLRNPTVSTQAIALLKARNGIGAGIELLGNMIAGLVVTQTPEPNFAGVIWHAFWNPYPFFTDTNDLSIALHLSINGMGFLFPGDLQTAGWKNILTTNAKFREIVRATRVLVASHHGRDDGICTELFDDYGCSPQIVVISDDYHQYETQNTTPYYESKCSGIDGFRGQAKRRVLTTRSDGDITFTFNQQGCIVN